MDNGVSVLSAFLAGVVSFLSPCVLPMIPTYTAYLAGAGSSGAGGGSQARLLTNAAFFLSGFTLVFVSMGATASLFGRLLFDYQDTIRRAGALFMVLMGVHLTGIFQFARLEREYRPLLNHAFHGPWGALATGVAFSVGWTPCSGPILASILIYAGSTGSMAYGAFLLAIYSAGFSLPFLGLALLLNSCIGSLRNLYRWMPVVQRMSGLALIFIGSAIYFNVWQRIFGSL